MMTSGVMTSFQVPSAVRMATVACIAFIIGNTTLQYVVHVLAPSMSAASSSAIGIFFKYPLYNNTFIGM